MHVCFESESNIQSVLVSPQPINSTPLPNFICPLGIEPAVIQVELNHRWTFNVRLFNFIYFSIPNETEFEYELHRSEYILTNNWKLFVFFYWIFIERFSNANIWMICVIEWYNNYDILWNDIKYALQDFNIIKYRTKFCRKIN